MLMKNSHDAWGAIARSFHWLVFLLFAIEITIAQFMEHPPFGMAKADAFMIHKSFGLLVLPLVLARIVWRFVDKAPQHVPGPAWQQRLQVLTHLALYGVMIAVPLSGYVMSVAGGKEWFLFGQWSVPNMVGIDPDLRKLAKKAHFFFIDVTWGLVAVHVVAIGYHFHVHKVNIMNRMLPEHLRRSAS